MIEQHVRLAQQLPSQLLRFFTKYPPPQIAATPSKLPSFTQSDTIQIAENTSSFNPNAGASVTELAVDPAPYEFPKNNPNVVAGRKVNPFFPFRNPRTGNWHPPAYSLRRQADLYKLAKAHDVLSLMPISPKHPEVKLRKRVELGLQVQGTGVGKKVKGKQWERTLKQKLEERRKAMEGMPELIRQWKQRGHGRGWKKWPS